MEKYIFFKKIDYFELMSDSLWAFLMRRKEETE